MSELDCERALDWVQWIEGGISDDSADRGGLTPFGIASATWGEKYPGFFRNPTKAKAREILRIEYWERWDCDELPSLMNVLYMDLVVNHSLKAAGMILQRGIGGVAIDGIVGRATRARAHEKANKVGPVVSEVLSHRVDYYARLVAQDARQQRFMRGWTRRSLALSYYLACLMCGADVQPDGTRR